MSNKAKIEFFGTAELLKKLEKAGANLEKEMANAFYKSVEKPKKEMIDFMKTEPKNKTGRTVASWTEDHKTLDSMSTMYKHKRGQIVIQAGFSVKKGGLGALFWNLGTPYRSPTFFIDNAIDNNLDEIKKIQLETLKKVFKEFV